VPDTVLVVCDLDECEIAGERNTQQGQKNKSIHIASAARRDQERNLEHFGNNHWTNPESDDQNGKQTVPSTESKHIGLQVDRKRSKEDDGLG